MVTPMTNTAEQIRDLKNELQRAKDEREEAEESARWAEARAIEAEAEANQAVGVVSSLRRHVWRDDKPGATYCVGCGRTWPIHRHDCPFGEVD